MDDIDMPEDPQAPAQPSTLEERPGLTTWSAFLEHLRHGHGMDKVPEDETEAWRLHQQLHGR